MITRALLLCVLALQASGEPWPERVGDEAGFVREYDHPVAAWFGLTVPATRTGEVVRDRDAARDFASAVEFDPDLLEYEGRSAHIVGVREPREGESADGFRYAVVLSASPTETDAVRLHRTWFRFRSPDNARGLVVLMPGMLGTPGPFLDRFERSLLGERWAVLRMLVPPSRTTEHLPIAIAVDDPRTAIGRLAAELDERTAECAYAVEAGLGWARSIEPSLGDRPSALVGMSGTGMMLPAVLLRNRAAFDAAVIIGSGANSFRILRESSYADMLDSVRVSWEPARPSAGRLAEIDAMYLEASLLDAHAVAPRVAEVPMLLIMGAADHAVPTPTGELLWERLGEPERWLIPVGHELLFGVAALRIGEIIDWLGTHAAEPAQ